MNKKDFLSKVVVTSVLAVGINLLPLPNINAGNFQVSVAYAESKNFAAKEAAMTDVELIETQAKEASRLRAIEAVKEKIAAYVRNFSGAKGKLNEDDIAAIAEKFEQVGETKYQKLFYNAVDEDGKELGKVGIMYEATVTAKFNSKKITEYIKLTAQEKERRIRQAREAREKFEELDREYEELRKNARTKTPEQMQAEIQNYEEKVKELEKNRNKISRKKNTTPKEKAVKNAPMKFSNLVEMGTFGWTGSGGIYIKDATSVSEQPQKVYSTLNYAKGVARFGDGKDAIYLYYDSKTSPHHRIGGQDATSTLTCNVTDFRSTIFKIKVNNGYAMYFISKNYDIPESHKQYILVGRRPDGKWVKYFDTEDLSKQYMGKSENVAIQKITFNGDTIIAQYARCNYPKDNNFYASKANEFGEFKFKWDESAKWFGVEKITYNQKPTEQKPTQENKPVTNQPMQFSQPVKIGSIGFVTKSPFHGFSVEGSTYNDAVKSYFENPIYSSNGVPIKTYVKGVAYFGQGDFALYCNYNFNEDFIKFGGKNNYILTLNGDYKDLYKIDSNSGVVLYVLHYHYTTTRLNIIGKQKDGKWVSFIDSKKISDMYFDGKDAYNLPEGVLYQKPTCNGDTIIIQYCRLRSSNVMEGEIRLKWDNKAQWFGIDKVTY